MKEPTITITLSEYNKLIDLHTDRMELPQKIEIKEDCCKFARYAKHLLLPLLSYKKNIEQKKLIRISIELAVNHIYNEVYGYWRSCMNDDMREHFIDFKRKYKAESYRRVLDSLK